MQSSVFVYTAGSVCVSSFTGTGQEFYNVSAGLSTVWQMVSTGIAGAPLHLSNLLYCGVDGSLTAKLSDNSTYTIYGARFHGELSSQDAGSLLLEKIRKQAL